MNDSAVLVVPDAPKGLDFGIDVTSYETGPNFQGLSLIPPGLHFIYHSVGVGCRQGQFLHTSKSEVIVRHWDSKNEEIAPKDSLSDGARLQLIEALNRGRLNEKLGPYPLSDEHLWKNLTSFITPEVLRHCNCCAGACILSNDSADITTSKHAKKNSDHYVTPTFADVRLVESKLNELANMKKKDQERDTQDIDDLTAINMDKSSLISTLLKSEYAQRWEGLLGELQLSFILFMLIFSNDALEQWKKLISTICQSENYLQKNPGFTQAFLRVFYEQLHYAPADFFTTELSRDNFLRPAMSALFSALDTTESHTVVAEHRRRLITFVQKKFGLYEESEEMNEIMISQLLDRFNLVDDDAPTVVDAGELATIGHGNVDEASNPTKSTPAIVDSTLNPFDGEHDANIVNKQMSSGGIVDGRSVKAKWASMDAAMVAAAGVQDTVSRPVDAMAHLAEAPLDKQENAQHTGDSADVPMAIMSTNEIEKEMFNWRYPSLHEEMMRSPQGAEDLVMTAARIIDLGPQSAAPSSLLAEAKMFLEFEQTRG
jgi:A1 cistron-splicing factor AAR2